MRDSIREATSLVLAAALLGTLPGGLTSQDLSIAGRVLDADRMEAVRDAVVLLVEPEHVTLTDATGRFSFSSLPPGSYTLRVSHLTYGIHERGVLLPEESHLSVRLLLSPTALTLDPVVVEVLSDEELRRRAAGVSLREVTREQIQRVQTGARHIGDVLALYVPGVQVSTGVAAGGTVCVELRGAAANRRGLGRLPCRPPVVYLDGVATVEPEWLFRDLPLEHVERIEVVPPAEAGVLYGSDSNFGALLIETRTPGPDWEDVQRSVISDGSSYDWGTEERGHRTGRVLTASLLGNALGLTAGFALADRCLHLRDPHADQLVADCPVAETIGAGVAAVVLPALAGAAAARWGGRTPRSQGQLLPAVLAASMSLVPGYGLAVASERDGSAVMEWTGKALIVLGAPLAVTLADRLFRSLRQGTGH